MKINTEYKVFAADSLHVAYNKETLQVYLIDKDYYSILNREFPMLLDDLKKDLNNEFRESFDGIQKKIHRLMEEGLLYSEDTHSRSSFPNGTSVDRINKIFEAKTLYLSIAQDCNLRCKYCSAGYGRFGKAPKYMRKEVAKQSLDFIFGRTGDDKERGIIFAGGEPLLNLDILFYVLDYGTKLAAINKKELYFSFNTNGTLLTEDIIGRLAQYKTYVTFSIDGTKKIHDSYRRFPDGRGTFELVAKNFKNYSQRMRQERGYFYPRVQVCLPFGKGLYEAYNNLKELGASMLVMNPAWPSEYVKHDLSIKASDIAEYLSEYEQMLQDHLRQLEFMPRGSHCLMSSTLQSVSHLMEGNIKPLGCGAANDGFAISPEGDVYPCGLLLENQDFWIGNILKGVSTDRMVAVQQKVCDFAKKCEGCWAKALCGAACIAMAVVQGTENCEEPTPYCDLFRGYIERDIIFFAKMRLKQNSLCSDWQGTGSNLSVCLI